MSKLHPPPAKHADREWKSVISDNENDCYATSDMRKIKLVEQGGAHGRSDSRKWSMNPPAILS
jgi:hypothetical protein